MLLPVRQSKLCGYGFGGHGGVAAKLALPIYTFAATKPRPSGRG